jgi:hypothetical protein
LEYLSLGNTNNILDWLISQSMIVPVIGIFVPPVDRTAEYAGSKKDAFTAFIVEELMPVIEQKYAVSKDPHLRATLGASNGGNISLYLGMKHPEVFGKIGAQSSNVETVISGAYQNNPKMDLELYLDIGTYDIAVLIPMVSNFVQILQEKNYVYQSKIWHEGHSWGSWKGHLRHALIQFFPPGTGLNENPVPESIRLYQNYPNPFRAQTRIDFEAPSSSHVELKIYDFSGKMIESISNKTISGIKNSIIFTNDNLVAGTYYYSLLVKDILLTRKMNVSN